MESSEYFVMVDTETTGIEIHQGHVPLEVGLIVTDLDFKIVDKYSVVIRWAREDILRKARMSKDEGRWVIKTHTDNNLINECCNPDISVSYEKADGELAAFMQQWFYPGHQPMCGSTIGFDRQYVEKFFPKFNACFHYRSIDISSVKELCRRLNPELYAKVPEKRQEMHRVVPDLEDSAAEAKFYADNFLFQNWG